MRAHGLSIITIGLLIMLPDYASSGGDAHDADSVRAVLAPLLASWGEGPTLVPKAVAEAFSRAIPARILSHNLAGSFAKRGFTVEAMRGFYAAVRFPSPSDSSIEDWACYMGGNAGYCAIVEEKPTATRVVWSAYPMGSLVQPQFEFVELTGDSIPELVLSGLVGLQMHMNGEIMSWDGETGRWLTAGDSVIGGYSWNYEPTGVGQTKRIVIYDTPTLDRRKGPRTRQVVEYDRSRKALVWRPKEVVAPEQK